MGGPQAGTPRVGETIRDGRRHLTVTDVQADVIRLEDAKGKRESIRLEAGVRFDWNADLDVWERHE